METKNIIVVFAVVIVSLVVLVSARNMLDNPVIRTTETRQSVNQPANDLNIQNGYQIVRLTYENYQYQMYPNILKKGVPVRMEVDPNTVTGCMVAVRIPGFNVAKTISRSDNIITFTPDKTGTFAIACSMGMGKNTFTVVDENGQNTGSIDTSPAEITEEVVGGSCGGINGGCGCGGPI